MSASRRPLPLRLLARLRWRASRLSPVLRGMLWAGLAGLQFIFLNAVMRELTRQLGPFETLFLRYAAGIVVLTPLMLRAGLAYWRPLSIPGQFLRGALHTGGLTLWFLAVVHVSLADTTAISFSGPLLIMLGASLFLGEPMRWARWVAALAGFCGVLLVMAPRVTGEGGGYMLVMLASTSVFAGSYLLTKALTRHERPEVIVVWQTFTVACFGLPLALLWPWIWPSAGQWALVLLCGVMGSSGNYCMTRAFKTADISATQPVKFLELLWASLLGWALFGELPTAWTLAGGVVIAASTVWLARREAREAREVSQARRSDALAQRATPD
ncbi:MAG: DMT family transporter [Ramlibacter sp.]|uniref:DMT family transporter n=1 Tax=Ramlibacter sp. TaxID=1917967 RepID=UPI00260B6E06|nr:DMT family transporter [Ramlibacter sp.]MDH4376339.1 DMT family transporter [Ramlibacter sp.]